jgi:hypothetical protein
MGCPTSATVSDRAPSVAVDGSARDARLVADGVARDVAVDTGGTLASIPIEFCPPPCRGDWLEEAPFEIVVEGVSLGATVVVGDDHGRPLGSLPAAGTAGSIVVQPRGDVRHRLNVATPEGVASLRAAVRPLAPTR